MGVASRRVTWGFLWLMLALKIPLVGLICIVWWAIKQEPDETSSSQDDDGGIKRDRVHPRKPRPPPGGLVPCGSQLPRGDDRPARAAGEPDRGGPGLARRRVRHPPRRVLPRPDARVGGTAR